MSRFAFLSTVIWLTLSFLVGAQLLFFGQKQPVKMVSAEQVHKLLDNQTSSEEKAVAVTNEKPRAEFVLVDVRSSKEQDVSMIPGAITVEQFEKDRQNHRGKTVIAYCTIGVRSEHYARKLLTSGQNALNFKGSILGWCDAKYPLVTPDGKSTQRVHTYSARYSKVPAEYTAVY